MRSISGRDVAHGVEGFFGTGGMPVLTRGAAATRLAKVDVARQFADDEDVQARDQLGLEAGSIDQLLVADGGAEVGKQAQGFAQTQDGLLGAQRALQRVVLPVAHGTEQNGIGSLASSSVAGGRGWPCGFVACTAHGSSFHLQVQVQGVQDLDGLGNDFGTDAVTRQDWRCSWS